MSNQHFDPTEAWNRLSPAEQGVLGALSLDLAKSWVEANEAGFADRMVRFVRLAAAALPDVLLAPANDDPPNDEGDKG